MAGKDASTGAGSGSSGGGCTVDIDAGASEMASDLSD